MPLVKNILVNAIKNAQTQASQEQNIVDALNTFADLLAEAIDAYIKSGIVNVTVATTGTAAAQAGTGIGSIS